MGFENVGPQWDRDEPWQSQQAKIAIRGLTDASPWMRHQRRVLFCVLLAVATLAVVAIAVSAILG